MGQYKLAEILIRENFRRVIADKFPLLIIRISASL